ncbi:MAG: DNA repair protein RadC [Pseudomonadota bacterium]
MDNLSSWRAEDKPRERLLGASGAAGTGSSAGQLATVELLAVLLGTGSRGEDAVALARRLLATYTTLDRLLAATPAELLRLRGLGTAKVARLKALHELTLRHAEERMLAQRVFSDAMQVSRYIQRRIGHRTREVFGCLYLDTRHRFLAWEELFLGSVNRAHVHAREVLRRSLELNAAAVIFGHNHPSGVAEPSRTDLQLTGDLADLLRRVDVEVLDHVVVAPEGAVSMAARGLLRH